MPGVEDGVNPQSPNGGAAEGVKRRQPRNFFRRRRCGGLPALPGGDEVAKDQGQGAEVEGGVIWDISYMNRGGSIADDGREHCGLNRVTKLLYSRAFTG